MKIFHLSVILLFLPILAQGEFYVKDEGKYLRLKIDAQKNDIAIKSEKQKITLNLLNDDLYLLLINRVDEIITPEYIEKISEGVGASLVIDLKKLETEVFSYYDDKSNQYVFDFWNGGKKVEAVEIKKITPKKEKVREIASIKKETLPLATDEVSKVSQDMKVVVTAKKEFIDEQFKDFRYGASLLWEYEPDLPTLEIPFTLENKTPEYFAPFNYKGTKAQELNFAYKLYQKKDYGLMGELLKKLEKSNKDRSLDDYIAYLKGNALLKQYHATKGSELLVSALAIFEEVADRTDNYDLKMGLFQFLMYQKVERNNPVAMLKSAQKLFVNAKKNFDEDLIRKSGHVILNSLARLKQKEKIRKFLTDASVKKFLNNQVGYTYQLYVDFLDSDYQSVVKSYEEVQVGLQKPILAPFLFNVAESYFQIAEYEKAQKLFEEYITHYSHLGRSSEARLRNAICLDLANKADALAAYKESIDLSGDAKIRYEAKLRYVGFKIRQPKLENEKIVTLLDYDQVEKKQLDRNLKRLLWLVRLRTFIKTEKYASAYQYYESIPLDSMNFYQQNVFKNDFDEIILGLITKEFEQKKYSNVVKIFEEHKNTGLNSINDISIPFFVSLSYLNLGFEAKFIETVDLIKSLQLDRSFKEYPIWVVRDESVLNYQNIVFNKLAIQGDWSEVEKLYLKSENKNYVALEFYLNSLYKQKKMKAYLSEIEKSLTSGSLAEFRPESFQEHIELYIKELKITKDKQFLAKLNALYVGVSIKQFPELKEKLNYFLIEESYQQKAERKKIVEYWTSFDKNFKKSQFYLRAKYIYAMALVNVNENEQEGRNVLNEIIQDKSSPQYLKKLARSELKTIDIEKNI